MKPVVIACLVSAVLGGSAVMALAAADDPPRFAPGVLSCPQTDQAAFLLADIRGLETRAFAMLERLTGRTACQAARPGPQLCAARNMLKLRGEEMRRLSDGLTRAGLILARAEASARLGEEVLAEEISLFGKEALTRLRRGSEALAAGQTGVIDSAAWAMTADDLSRVGNALVALAALDLANAATGRLGRRLQDGGAELDSLGTRLDKALTSGVAAREPDVLETGLQRLGAEMETLIAEAESAARAARADAGARIDTTASAQPVPGQNNAQVAACLDKAALSLALAADAQGMLETLLSEAFPAQSCPAPGADAAPGTGSPRGLDWLLQSDLEFEKTMFDLDRRLCPAR